MSPDDDARDDPRHRLPLSWGSGKGPEHPAKAAMTTQPHPTMGRPPSYGPGDERGAWRIIGPTDERSHGQVVYAVECTDCGYTRRIRGADMKRTKCCAPRKTAPRPVVCADFSPDTPWEQDTEARVLVRLWGPMSLHEIGDLWGLSRERIRQIEKRALEHFANRCQLAGLRAEDVAAYFAGKQPTTWERIELLDTGA